MFGFCHVIGPTVREVEILFFIDSSLSCGVCLEVSIVV